MGDGRRALDLAREGRAYFGELLPFFRVDLRVREIEVFHRFNDRGGDGETSEPPAVGWDDEPGCVLRCGGANGRFVRVLVVVPKPAFVYVRGGELPVLLWSVEALHEALFLLLGRQVQKEFEDDDSLTGEIVLEVRDV